MSDFDLWVSHFPTFSLVVIIAGKSLSEVVKIWAKQFRLVEYILAIAENLGG
jgi:hypothetical protein